MTRKVEERYGYVPGTRTVVKLDVAEASLPILLEGIDGHCWLTEEGDGLYRFHATQRLRDLRKQPGPIAIDVLTEALEEFGDTLDQDDVPQHVRDAWDRMVERYEARTKRPPERPERKQR